MAAPMALQPVDQVDGRHWSHIQFISDVHLQRSEDATYQAWSRYMQNVQADALFILGDLFEVWVGDDLLQTPDGAFEAECLNIIRRTAQRLPVYGLVGNRDFLMGATAWATANMQQLQDPCVLHLANHSCLLSHGDELCTDDTNYQVFRRQVRSADWQLDFLNKPLTERVQIARALRQQSEELKALQTHSMDVNSTMAQTWLIQHNCSTLVHGHTHQAAQHHLALGERWVLSDWEANAHTPRLQALQWRAAAGFKPVQLTD